jgi:deoxyribodipyrimidine photo-lyase
VPVVWLKRDLRLHDHPALNEALAYDRAIVVLYVFEPGLWALPESHRCHFDAIVAALGALDDALRVRGGQLTVRTGRILEVLADLDDTLGIATLHSSQETGLGWTYGRDLAVGRFCAERGIPWHETVVDGVVRRQPDRDGWGTRRAARMRIPQVRTPDAVPTLPMASDWPTAGDLGLTDAPTEPHPAGERVAEAALERWRREDAVGYERRMSSPVTGWDGSSRMSVHLAYGTMSPRRATQQIARRLRAVEQRRDADWVRSLTAYSERLAWRDHFIQRLEDQPSMQYRCLLPATEGLRRSDADRLDAWLAGRTGYPMVDAVMRSLAAQRWTTFRMRAMVVSFATYDLWLPWRDIAAPLAQRFVDFEPGIHYSQLQMQAGTTGISALRIYDPTKQARDHDPDGVFIRRWVPELAHVPADVLATPWELRRDDRQRFGSTAYPDPIVDHGRASAAARRRLEAVRATDDARQDARAVFTRHGSRRSRARGRRRR